MESKKISRQALLSISVLGLAIFSAILFYFYQQNVNIPIEVQVQSGPPLFVKNIVAPLPVLKEVRSPLPARLKIPKLNVDAVVLSVGLTKDGAMGVPEGPTDVAWFDLGSRPGEKGSAVIAGHFGWKNNIPAVFDSLGTLKKGDLVSIEDETGTTTTFVVRELRTYGENQDASDVFDSNDGKAHLNLVTCQGIWNKNKKSYSQRLVVFTDKK
jgi:LPXTG-site transpeptidase (sortase) family protein